jgi:hypothetical protein
MTNKRKQKAAELTLPAAPSIRNIDQIHGMLVGALAKGSEVVLSIDGDADPDLSVIQLIEVARLHAESKGRSFRLADPANSNIRKTLTRAGLQAGAGAAFNQFWFHEENAQ